MKKALILAGISWNDTYQRHQQIAEYLLTMGYEVFFVEHIVSSKLTVRKLWGKIKSININRYNDCKEVGRRRVSEKDSFLSIIDLKFVNPGKGLLYLYNNLKVKKLRKVYIEKTGSSHVDLIINYLPISTTKMIVERFDYKCLIYDCVRDFKNWENAPCNIDYYEKYFVKLAAKVFVDSYFLLSKIEKHYKIKAYQFLPVVTIDWLEGCKGRSPVKNISDFGYFGTIDQHIDVEVFRILTDNGYRVHIWGKIDKNPGTNCIYHGFQKDMSVLAKEILKYSNAIIIPYKGNMDGVIPAKIMQALSTMLPVFCSTFYDSQCLKNYLYLFQKPEELIELIKKFRYDKHREKTLEIEKYLEDKDESEQYDMFKKIIGEELF